MSISPAVGGRTRGRSSLSVLAQSFFGQSAAPSGPASPYDKIPLGGDLPKEYSQDIPNWALKRRAGIILHPTSLPGAYGIGEIGEQARRFLDWLESAGMQCWQILPLVPPDPMFFSPYSGTDSNAGNPLVISLDELVKDGLLAASDLPARVPVGDVDFEKVRPLPCGPEAGGGGLSCMHIFWVAGCFDQAAPAQEGCGQAAGG